MDARSALFDLYGDHLRDRGGKATIASLVRLLAALDIAAPAVRTAVSRMVRQGWLEPVRLPAGPAYALTPRAVRRLDEAAHRIYRDLAPWDGHWQVLVIERVRDRARRERLTAGLGYLGYAPLGENTWIGPRPSPELDPLLDAEQVRAERFRSTYDGDVHGLVARGWDLDGLARAYERWLAETRELTGGESGDGSAAPNLGGADLVDGPPATEDAPIQAGNETADEHAFAVRSRLVHEWRKFLFRDPGLPSGLLPPDWPGFEAARFFDAEAARLLPGASRFVDRCLRVPSPA
ncbi:PaaX family transcriptional regulator C-terminal domain-containing protein [Actinomadura sp. HBU206391]|uniref:PaaX family transcriptional regulator n=1 Tax=Actinomadura sp. HBU206391 TaxID=2731692 RepID=UPI00165052A3|nr:PaaX family transcriptional regulator C-terminal domain-containing protein [Actinomadura sp. HBU206391]MBC6457823.1 PaaX family transcriptional regulator [Actinomadura sp. HBU206391]